jgi:hypothetical protein
MAGSAEEILAGAFAGEVLARSHLADAGLDVALGQRGCELRLLALGEAAAASELEGERREVRRDGERHALLECAPSPANARALQRLLPALAPRPLDGRLSVGCGDRLGVATPGHLRAVRGTGIAPVIAQQSIREMERSGRTPEQVMADAVFGALREGWTRGFGSDADHLKSEEQIDRCLAAGFTAFTLDPSEHVQDAADALERGALDRAFAALDFAALESGPADLLARHVGRALPLAGVAPPGEEQVARAAVKYGGAVAHVARLFRHLEGAAGTRPFEVEVSVDETGSPTSCHEHHFVARELARLGVRWVALAPRFVGEFEKGVDYRGDLGLFRAEFARHVALARELGGYKLSLHSGSDKFSVYPICAELARGRFHLKTAGTSWLEALRCVAETEPGLFREIYAHARSHYESDRASYHVSAELAREPDATQPSDAQLPALLDRDGARQVLHVTFGSVLTARDARGAAHFREAILAVLQAHAERHAELLEAHFGRHLAPFAGRRA